MSNKPKALIVGTGIGGLSCGVALKKIGWEVQFFEKSDELRVTGSGLSVMSNASAAMKKLLNIDLNLEKYGAEITKFEIKHKSGLSLSKLPFKEIAEEQGAPSVCISRQNLQKALLDQLGSADIFFGKHINKYTETESEVQISLDDGTIHSGDILIGADGFYSSIRDAIETKSVIQEAGYICWLALVKYSNPQINSGSVVHYWGKGKRIGIIDIGNGWVYWWGTANMSNIKAQNWTGTNKDVVKFYSGWPSIVKNIILSTDSNSIITVDAKDRSFPEKWTKGRVALLGDAAHPMLTSLGQGAGMSIEDAAVLAHTLKDADDYCVALRRYEEYRKPRARAVVEASRALSVIEQYDQFIPRLKRDLGMLITPSKALNKKLKESLWFEHHAI